jgi:hypothetical protein
MTYIFVLLPRAYCPDILIFVFFYLFVFYFEIGSSNATQAGLDIPRWSRLPLNLLSSCLCLLSAGSIGLTQQGLLFCT